MFQADYALDRVQRVRGQNNSNILHHDEVQFNDFKFTTGFNQKVVDLNLTKADLSVSLSTKWLS